MSVLCTSTPVVVQKLQGIDIELERSKVGVPVY